MRSIIAGCLIAGCAGAAVAQSSDNRLSAGQPAPITFTVAFIDSPPICPERHGALQISGHTFWLVRSPAGDDGGGVGRTVDDQTYRYRMISRTYDCVVDVTLRAQVYRNGAWTPLLVTRGVRPSLQQSRSTDEYRKKLEEAIAAAARRREAMTPKEQDEARQAWLNGPGPIARMTRINQQTKGTAGYIQFEGMPEHCVNAVGEYRLDQTRITFRFPTNFSDDYNRLAAELARIDGYRGQFALVRGDCRVEITIGKAIRDRDRWLPIPIASIGRSG